jgi:hypothetical protein
MDRLARPDWVPQPVAETAMRLYAAARLDERKELIVRLATDDRMERVWKTLCEEPHIKPKPVAWPKTVEERQICAARVFDVATRTTVRAFSAKEVAALQHDVADLAARLDRNMAAVARMRPRLRLASDADDKIRMTRSLINDLMSAYAAAARMLPIVSHRRIAWERGYLFAVATAMRVNFGIVMKPTVATIASVALDQKVTARKVPGALRPGDGG